MQFHAVWVLLICVQRRNWYEVDFTFGHISVAVDLGRRLQTVANVVFSSTGHLKKPINSDSSSNFCPLTVAFFFLSQAIVGTPDDAGKCDPEPNRIISFSSTVLSPSQAAKSIPASWSHSPCSTTWVIEPFVPNHLRAQAKHRKWIYGIGSSRCRFTRVLVISFRVSPAYKNPFSLQFALGNSC